MNVFMASKDFADVLNSCVFVESSFEQAKNMGQQRIMASSRVKFSFCVLDESNIIR